jgi:hypothetical protein
VLEYTFLGEYAKYPISQKWRKSLVSMAIMTDIDQNLLRFGIDLENAAFGQKVISRPIWPVLDKIFAHYQK